MRKVTERKIQITRTTTLGYMKHLFTKTADKTDAMTQYNNNIKGQYNKGTDENKTGVWQRKWTKQIQIIFVTVFGSSLVKVVINIETRLVGEANYDFWNIHPVSRNGKYYLHFCRPVGDDVRRQDDVAGGAGGGEDGRWNWHFNKKTE